MSDRTSRVEGHVAPGFEPVREAFERNFREFGEVGASVAVTVDGEPVVDLWGGDADAKGRPWERDTIVNVYSTTKGMTAVCAHMLASRGLLDVEAPVTSYWPEFAQAGKESMPVKYLLTHQAGLPVVDAELPPNASLDWDVMIEALAQQEPIWEPGTKNGYHAVTFGWLVGEVIRRISGSSVGTFLRDEVAGPLGVDFFIGTPASEDHRVATMLRATPPPRREGEAPSEQAQRMAQFFGPGSLAGRSLGLASAPHAPGNNTREWRAAEIPAANGHGNARALATIYGALSRGGEIGGVRLMSAAAVERARMLQVDSADEVLIMRTRRSLGFMLPAQEQDRRPPHAFGHGGAGGSMGFADVERRIGFGYAMNQMWGGGLMQPDPRAQGLVGALYECVRA